MIIAIDGPAASGKGTLAKRLAAHYGYRHLDTGAIYRAVAYALISRGADLADEIGHLKGLDAEEDDVGLLRGGEIVVRDFDAPLGGERGGAVGVGNGCDELLRREDLLLEEGLEQDAAHLAGSENGDAEMR